MMESKINIMSTFITIKIVNMHSYEKSVLVSDSEMKITKHITTAKLTVSNNYLLDLISFVVNEIFYYQFLKVMN